MIQELKLKKKTLIFEKLYRYNNLDSEKASVFVYLSESVGYYLPGRVVVIDRQTVLTRVMGFWNMNLNREQKFKIASDKNRNDRINIYVRILNLIRIVNFIRFDCVRKFRERN